MSSILKTREELLVELERLQARLVELERTGAEREQAVAALRESEERWRSLVQNASNIIFTVDQEGKILFINRTVIGFTVEQVIGSSSYDYVPAEFHDTMRKTFARVFQTGVTEDYESESLGDHCEPAWYSNRISAMKQDGKVTTAVVIASDITERKRVEKALQESEERLQAQFGELNLVYQCSPVGLYVLDRNLRFLRVNQKLAEIDGLPIEGHLGRTIFEVVPNLAERLQRLWRPIFEKGEPVLDVEIQGETPKSPGEQRYWLASYFPVKSAAGEVTGLIAAVSEITERKRAEEKLRENESRFRILSTLAPVGIFQTDTQGDCQFVNDRWCELAGISAEQAAGRGWVKALHSEDREWIMREWYGATQAARDFISDYRFQTPDGEVRWLSGHATALFNESGEPIGYLGTITDITERKRAEEEKERLAAQLLHLQKMQAVGQLAGGLAHDFNNFLTVILGNSERLLARKGRGSDENSMEAVKDGLKEITLAAQRAAALSQQLLAFGRKETVRTKVLDLGRIVRSQEELLRRLIREDIVFDVKVASDTSRIRADASEIEQVVMNLVLNARDAMPRRGTLTITCANIDLDEVQAAAHIGAKPGPHAMLAVSDTGVGMNKETMEHMFEPFFTTKPIGKGTGLGLATVYGIAKRTGAHISVESELGRGSTFRLDFPAGEGEAQTLSVAASVERVGGEEVILVCEDDELVRRGACRDLRAAGYTVLEAENGKHALEVAASHGDKIDLMVSDVIMPEMNGKQLAEAMTTLYPEMRIVFISGYTDDVFEPGVSQGKGRDFLQKPFAPNDLLRRVRHLLDQTWAAA